MQEQLQNIFANAQKAVADDLRQNFYNAVEARTQAFRQLNNKANYNHSLFSGRPAAAQMQYDRDTLLPGTATMAQQAIAKQAQNQESWDTYMEYVKKLNDQAAQYNSAAQNLNSQTGLLSQADKDALKNKQE